MTVPSSTSRQRLFLAVVVAITVLGVVFFTSEPQTTRTSRLRNLSRNGGRLGAASSASSSASHPTSHHAALSSHAGASPAFPAFSLLPAALAPHLDPLHVREGLFGQRQISMLGSALCIDIPGGSTAPGTTPILYRCQPAKELAGNQLWRLDQQDGRIVSILSGHCLTAVRAIPVGSRVLLNASLVGGGVAAAAEAAAMTGVVRHVRPDMTYTVAWENENQPNTHAIDHDWLVRLDTVAGAGAGAAKTGPGSAMSGTTTGSGVDNGGETAATTTATTSTPSINLAFDAAVNAVVNAAAATAADAPHVYQKGDLVEFHAVALRKTPAYVRTNDKPTAYGFQYRNRYGRQAVNTAWQNGQVVSCGDKRIGGKTGGETGGKTGGEPGGDDESAGPHCTIALIDRRISVLVPANMIRPIVSGWVRMRVCQETDPVRSSSSGGGGAAADDIAVVPSQTWDMTNLGQMSVFGGSGGKGRLPGDRVLCLTTTRIQAKAILGLQPCQDTSAYATLTTHSPHHDHHHGLHPPHPVGSAAASSHKSSLSSASPSSTSSSSRESSTKDFRFDHLVSRQLWLRHGCTAETSQCSWWHYQTTIPSCCRGHLIRLTQFVMRACKRLGQSCWVAWGSLLGAVREGDHIGHETDMDMYVPAGAASALLRKEMTFLARTEGLPYEMVQWNSNVPLEDDDRDPRRDGGEPWRLFFSHNNKIHIDLWLYDVDVDPDTAAPVAILGGRDYAYIFPREMLLPLRECPYGEEWVPCPAEAQRVLREVMYGPTWNVSRASAGYFKRGLKKGGGLNAVSRAKLAQADLHSDFDFLPPLRLGQRGEDGRTAYFPPIWIIEYRTRNPAAAGRQWDEGRRPR